MPEQDTGPVEVMLDIFSGRPNPTWALTAREIEELRLLLGASTGERRENAGEDPGLGYGGFIITNRGQLGGLPFRCRVYDGVISMTEKETTHYADVHRVESWLLDQAADRGYAGAIEKMGGPSLQRGGGREQRYPG